MARNVVRRIAGGAAIFLWAFLTLSAAQVFAQQAVLPGTEKAPVVGAQAPLFALEGFDLKQQLERGSLILLFYRGYF